MQGININCKNNENLWKKGLEWHFFTFINIIRSKSNAITLMKLNHVRCKKASFLPNLKYP